ncbi:MAG: SET domain-containing protein-lysine N-methyltransferase [Leptospiraceae bacterium]|nr:SET domain-containing protein-lysine N-methyltransferase [Leptospiraceae bacterium]
MQKVQVLQSPIHGKGVFARAPITKGSLIGSYEGPVAKRNGTYVLWITDEDGLEYGISGRNKLRYLNHSNRPNAEFDGNQLYARRLIKAGEEITFDYGEDPADFDE